MKKLFTCVCALIVMHLSAQNFTIGSFYNHQIGDTIIEEYVEYMNSSNGPPRLTLRAITNRQIAPTLDTIFYTEQRTSNQFQFNGSTYVMSYTNTTLSYYTTAFLQSLINYTFSINPNCQAYRDTTYTDTCGFKIHIKEIVGKPNTTPCFEPSYYKDIFIEPVGLYQIKACGNCLPRGLKTVSRLIYTNKGNRCGKSIVVATDLKIQNKPNPIFSIYPNPSAGIYYLTSEKYGEIEIFDAIGSKVKEVLIIPGANTIQLSDQPSGIYYIRSTDNSIKCVIKIAID